MAPAWCAEDSLRYLAASAICSIAALAGCDRDLPAAVCDSNTQCPTGYRCDQPSRLCVAISDAAIGDAAVEAAGDARRDAPAPDRTAADQRADAVVERMPVDVTNGRDVANDAASGDVENDGGAHDAGNSDGGAGDRGDSSTVTSDGPDNLCNGATCLPPRECRRDVSGETRCACPGWECNDGCQVGAQCCVDSDCGDPAATCNNHRCVFDATWQQDDNGYLGSEATFIDEWAPDTPYPNAGELLVRSSDVKAGLIRFDLSIIPARALVTYAALTLYDDSSSNICWIAMRLFRVLRWWDPDTATWNQASAGVSWDAPGCNSVGSDRSGTGTDPVVVNTPGQWYTFDVVADVQYWVNNPDQNHGLAVKAVDAQCSVEHHLIGPAHGTDSWHPALRVVYLVP